LKIKSVNIIYNMSEKPKTYKIKRKKPKETPVPAPRKPKVKPVPKPRPRSTMKDAKVGMGFKSGDKVKFKRKPKKIAPQDVPLLVERKGKKKAVKVSELEPYVVKRGEIGESIIDPYSFMYYFTGEGGKKDGILQLLLAKPDDVWEDVQKMLNAQEKANKKVTRKDIENAIEASPAMQKPVKSKFTGLTSEKANTLDAAELFGKLPVELRRLILDPKTTGVKIAQKLTEERVQKAIEARITAWIPKIRAGSANWRKQGNHAADFMLKKVGRRLPKRGGDWEQSLIAKQLIKRAGDKEAKEIVANFERITKEYIERDEEMKRKYEAKKKAEAPARAEQNAIKSAAIRAMIIEDFKLDKRVFPVDQKYFESYGNQGYYYNTYYDKSYIIDDMKNFGKDNAKSVLVRIGGGSRGARDDDDFTKTKRVPYLTFYRQTDMDIDKYYKKVPELRDEKVQRAFGK
jgi:hypothetical protein